MPDYRKPIPPGFELTEDELELKAKYGLDDEQLQWRRYTIRNDCGGDSRQFEQEYPSEPDEAFLLSGESIFDNKFIKRLKEAIKLKGAIHEIDFVKEQFIPAHAGNWSSITFQSKGSDIFYLQIQQRAPKMATMTLLM